MLYLVHPYHALGVGECMSATSQCSSPSHSHMRPKRTTYVPTAFGVHRLEFHGAMDRRPDSTAATHWGVVTSNQAVMQWQSAGRDDPYLYRNTYPHTLSTPLGRREAQRSVSCSLCRGR